MIYCVKRHNSNKVLAQRYAHEQKPQGDHHPGAFYLYLHRPLRYPMRHPQQRHRFIASHKSDIWKPSAATMPAICLCSSVAARSPVVSHPSPSR